MFRCEQCERAVPRRKRCRKTGAMLCWSCFNDEAFLIGLTIREARKALGAATRMNERLHDAIVYVHGGIPVFGRIAGADGKPRREPHTYAVHRRGVDANYVESQYHGRLPDQEFA